MKKLPRILALALLAASMGACSFGSQEPAETPNSEQSSIQESSASQSAAKSEASSKTAKAETAESREPAAKADTAGFEPVSFGNENCTVEFTGWKPGKNGKGELKLSLQNNTDKNLRFTTDDVSINGLMAEPLFSAGVAAGKKANDSITFRSSEPGENGLKDITDIEMTIRVYDDDDYSADDFYKETVHVYPYGQEKAETFEREAQPSDKTLIDNDAVSIIMTGYDEDPMMGGYAVDLYIVNKSDKSLLIGTDNGSIDGVMCEPFWADTLAPHKRALTSMRWSSGSLEEAGIETVGEIEMEFHGTDNDNWSDRLFEETITFRPAG